MRCCYLFLCVETIIKATKNVILLYIVQFFVPEKIQHCRGPFFWMRLNFLQAAEPLVNFKPLNPWAFLVLKWWILEGWMAE